MAKKHKSQLDLFSVAPTRPILAPPDPRVLALANALPPHLHLGSSSWNFRGWTGLVYRAEYRSDKAFTRDALYEYSRWPLWRTVGIDRSFYSPIGSEELAHYASLLPPDFRCVEKVWQEISTFVYPRHPRYGERSGQVNPHFLDPDAFARELVTPHSTVFSDRVAAFVFEISPLPHAPDVAFFEDRVERFLQTATRDYLYAFELRDPRLLTDRYFGLLREHGAVHCFNQWSHMPPLAQQLRLHGPRLGRACVTRLLLPAGANYEDLVAAYAPFDRLHAPQLEMREDVRKIVELAGPDNVPTYVIINNKAEGSAPLTAIALAELIAASAR